VSTAWTATLAERPLDALLLEIERDALSGSLRIAAGLQRGRIDFVEGRPVSARAPGVQRLGDLLVQRNLADPISVQEAARIQAEEHSGRMLGEILVANGVLLPSAIEGAVQIQIQQALSVLRTWAAAKAEFEPSRRELLPLPALPSTPPGSPTAPSMHHATKPFEQPNHDGTRPALDEAAETGRPRPLVATQAASPLPSALREIEPAVRDQATALSWSAALVSDDCDWAAELRAALPPGALHDAASHPGSAPQLQIRLIDAHLLEPVHAPLAAGQAIVAVARSLREFSEAYARGAIAVVPRDAEVVAQAVRNLVATWPAPTATPATPTPKSAPSATSNQPGASSLMLDLLSRIAQDAERAVLFLARNEVVAAVGAFGMDAAGSPLAQRIRSLRFSMRELPALRAALDYRPTKPSAWSELPLPPGLVRLLGEPISGQAAILPIHGEIGAIGFLYLDNGINPAPLPQLAELADACYRLGHMLETEFLIDEIAKVLA
jgi:hypothetical protein